MMQTCTRKKSTIQLSQVLISVCDYVYGVMQTTVRLDIAHISSVQVRCYVGGGDVRNGGVQDLLLMSWLGKVPERPTTKRLNQRNIT